MKKTILIIFSFLIAFCVLISPSIAKADNNLSIGSIGIDPTSPAVNEPCTITVRISNLGDSNLNDLTGLTSGDISVNFKDFSITKTTTPTVPIIKDSTVYYVFEGSFNSVGNKSVYFSLNNNGSLPEGTTRDNYYQTYVTVVEPYDYQINSISVFPSNPGVGEDAMIEVQATNNGYIPFTTNQDIADVSYIFPNFKVDNIVWPKIDYTDNKIKNGDKYYYRYYGKFTNSGKINLSYTLDPSNNIAEKSETNNSVNRDFEIFPLSSRDLKIDSITFSDNKPIVDENITITVKIKNTGQVSLISEKGLSVAGNFSTSPGIEKGFFYDLSDFKVDSFTYDKYPTLAQPLDPGEYFTYVFDGNFHNEGKNTLSLQVDQKKQLAESNYSDDASSTSITIYKDAADRDKFHITNYSIDFVSSSTAVFSWTTDKNSTGSVWYKQADFTSYVGETADSNNSTTHSAQINDLISGTLYKYEILANNGTEKDQVTDVVFTMPKNNDVVLTKLPVATVNSKRISIAWETNLLSFSHLFYRLAGTTSYTAVNDANLVSKHSISVDSLADGNYEYYVSSDSQVKTEIKSDIGKFTINTVVANTNTDNANTNTNNTSTSTQTTNTQTTQTQTSTPIVINNLTLYNNLKGKIILTVEAKGEAYYINPKSQTMNFLGRPDDAFNVMRSVGVGITNANLRKIQIGLTDVTGLDSDGDGLSNLLENAIGTDISKKDTDVDGYDDKAEVSAGRDPLKGNGAKYPIDPSFAKAQNGKILLQVEGKGEAWYINPSDNKRYFLGRPADAFAVMRKLGLGISNVNFTNLK